MILICVAQYGPHKAVAPQKLSLSMSKYVPHSKTQPGGQPVTYMRSTNNKPQQSNRFQINKIKSRPKKKFWLEELFYLDISHIREQKTQLLFHVDFKQRFVGKENYV